MEFILDEVIVALWWVGSDNNLHFRSVSEEEYVNHYIKVIQSMTKKKCPKEIYFQNWRQKQWYATPGSFATDGTRSIFFSCFDFIVRRT